MKDVFIAADNIISPIGYTAAENFEQLTKLVSGVKLHADQALSEKPVYAALFDNTDFFSGNSGGRSFTKFEKLLIASIADALGKTSIRPEAGRTALIISTTKGNINLLETEAYSDDLRNRISINSSAQLAADHFHFAAKPIVISNACISGLLAIITGMRMIQSGQCDHAVITGADVISKFVLSGFQSFQAISDAPCRPFDAARNGINLGEGAGTIILTADEKNTGGVKVCGGAVTNDANHISGPSRTGEELSFAITKAMKDAGVTPADVDFISAHGTATIYNDEMEANAITLSNIARAPLNSLKGYYGHTLGAAGIIETIVSMHSLQEGILIPTLGFQNAGVSKPVNVCSSLQHISAQNCLKTASGFGGCNAAIIMRKQ